MHSRWAQGPTEQPVQGRVPGGNSWGKRLDKLSFHFRVLWTKEVAEKIKSVGSCEDRSETGLLV